MSMKHEYKVGQPVYVKGNDHEPWLSDGDKVMITHLDNQGAIINCDSGITSIDLSDLSPYPPVKAVERYVVVDAEGNMYDEESQKPNEQLSIEAFCMWYGLEWRQLEKEGYRCIPVTITAKKDNNE